MFFLEIFFWNVFLDKILKNLLDNEKTNMKTFDIFTQKIKFTAIHQFTVRYCNNIAVNHS